MVSGSSPMHWASVVRPTGPAAEAAAEHVEDGPVDLVEAELVDAEHLEPGHGRRPTVMAPSARTSTKSRTRRSRRLAMRGVPRDRSAIRRAPVGVDRHPEDAGRPLDDGLELVGVVEVEPADEAEAVAQRARPPARSGWWRRPG